jgi:hypothetical protein
LSRERKKFDEGSAILDKLEESILVNEDGEISGYLI